MEKWQDPDAFITWLIVIIAVMALLVITLVSVFYFSYQRIIKANAHELKTKIEYQRKLLKISYDAQEQERMQIADDLHQNLISKLTAIRLKSAIGASSEELDRMIGQSIEESRRISHALSPPLYDEKPLENILPPVLLQWKSMFHIHTHLDVREEVMLDKNVKLQLVRILQELMNNIVKYSKASRIFFTLRITKDYTVFEIVENGIGLEESFIAKGIGLQSIQVRSEDINGLYKFKGKRGYGSRFIFLLRNEKNQYSSIR